MTRSKSGCKRKLASKEYKNLQMALFQLYAYAGQDYYTNEANGLIDSFFSKMEQPLEGVILRHLQIKVQDDMLPDAKEQFKKILDGYNLPKTEIMSAGDRKKTTTLREMAEEHFRKHVDDYQDVLKKSGIPGGEQMVLEPLLSPEYLKSLNEYLRANWLTVMLENAFGAEKVDKIIKDDFIENPEYADVFNPENAKTEVEKRAILTNQLSILTYSQNRIREVKRELLDLKGEISLEDFADIEDELKKTLQDKIKDVVKQEFLDSCMGRVRYVKDLEKYSSLEQSKEFAKEYLMDKLGKERVNVLLKTKKSFKVYPDGIFGSTYYTMNFENLVDGLVKYLHPRLEEEVKEPMLNKALDAGNTENKMLFPQNGFQPDTETDKTNRSSFQQFTTKFFDKAFFAVKIQTGDKNREIRILQLLFNQMKKEKI